MSEADSLITDSRRGSRKYASRRRSSQTERQALLLAEGAGDQTSDDQTVLWLLAIMSFLMTVLAVIYAFKANSMAIVVEATAEFVDFISYSLNLWCVYICRGKSLEYQEKMEKRTAIVSTVLLLFGGVRIALQSYAQVVCSMDIDVNKSDPNDHPCGLMMGTPHPRMVIFTATTMLLSYIPPFVVAYLQGANLNSYRPDENINKASALLHCLFDAVLQVTLLFASCIMLVYPAVAVEIDATTSCLLLVVMVAMTTYMWVLFYRAQDNSPNEP